MPHELRLGVSLHKISESIDGELFDTLKGSRIATMEIPPRLLDGEEAATKKADLKRVFRENGIRPMTIHARFGGPRDLSVIDEDARRRAVAEARASVDLAVSLDAPMIVVHASAEPILPDERPRRIAQARKSLAELAEYCRKAGRRIAVELLPRTCLGHSVDELFELMRDIDQDTIGACLDVNHLMDRYRALPEVVRRLGNRLLTLHLSDYDGVDEKHQSPGEGVIDWKAFLGALQAIGYTGPFNYESNLPGATPAARLQALQENFAWLSSLVD